MADKCMVQNREPRLDQTPTRDVGGSTGVFLVPENSLGTCQRDRSGSLRTSLLREAQIPGDGVAGKGVKEAEGEVKASALQDCEEKETCPSPYQQHCLVGPLVTKHLGI